MQEMVMERVTFKSLVESDESISEEKILSWLSNSRDVELEIGNADVVDRDPEYSITIEESPTVSALEVFALDPASAGVLIAGLSAILAWVSTERRHRESLAKKPPGKDGSGNTGDVDVCKKVEANKVCLLPLSNTMRVKGDGYLILFRACTKKPEPHTTVEYYEL